MLLLESLDSFTSLINTCSSELPVEAIVKKIGTGAKISVRVWIGMSAWVPPLSNKQIYVPLCNRIVFDMMTIPLEFLQSAECYT